MLNISEYAVFLSTIDNGNILEEFKNEILIMRNNNELHYKIVPFYIALGDNNESNIEPVIVVIYGGVPFIFTSSYSIKATNIDNISDSYLGSSFISSLFSLNNTYVYSLGFVNNKKSIMKYASNYVSKNPLMKHQDISDDIANDVLVSSNSGITVCGNITRNGGEGYAVYSVDHSVSDAIRINKNFADDPTTNTNIPSNMTEVLLVGGNPDIRYIGLVCNMKGHAYDVWTPNNINDIQFATDSLNSPLFPIDDICLDYDDMEDAMIMHLTYLKELDDTLVENDKRNYGEIK
jgi:hypothetical protein